MEVVDCCRKLLLEEVTGRWLCLNCGERRPDWGEWRGGGKMFGVGSACWRAWWDKARGRKAAAQRWACKRRLYVGGRHSLTSRDWEKRRYKRYWGCRCSMWWGDCHPQIPTAGCHDSCGGKRESEKVEISVEVMQVVCVESGIVPR